MSPSSATPERDGDAFREDLSSFVSAVCGEGVSRVEESFGDGYVRLQVAEAERRQAVHDIRHVEDAVLELLRNARDARAHHIFVATMLSEGVRRVVAVDDGVGIPAAMHDRVFDARVTSKLDTMTVDEWGVHGRGMALYAIRANALEARVASSAPGLGTSVALAFDTARLPERADQSTWPSRATGADDDGEGKGGVALRGPHNIPRTCVEFALADEADLDLYLGSPAEVVATLRSVAKATASEARLLFTEDLSELPPGLRLLAAPDAASLQAQAAALGLEISERTAHRILAGSVRPLRSVRARLRHDSNPAPRGAVDLSRDARGLRLTKEDTREFQAGLARAFDVIASRYFLELEDAPGVRVGKGRISVTFKVRGEDT